MDTSTHSLLPRPALALVQALGFRERNEAQVRVKFRLSEKAKALMKQPAPRHNWRKHRENSWTLWEKCWCFFSEFIHIYDYIWVLYVFYMVYWEETCGNVGKLGMIYDDITGTCWVDFFYLVDISYVITISECILRWSFKILDESEPMVDRFLSFCQHFMMMV